MSKGKTLALTIPFMTLSLAAIVALSTLAKVYAPTISLYLNGGDTKLDSKTLSENTELVEDIGEEGSVLLKNENSCLPLGGDKKKLNVFGWASYDWMTSMFGSGYSNTSLKKWKLIPALEERGIEVNTDLEKLYSDFYSDKTSGWGMSDLEEYRGDVAVGSSKKFILHEPGKAFYTEDILASARDFSDTSLVVIGRTGGEAADLRKVQVKQEQKNRSTATVTDTTRTYLQLSSEEEEMIQVAESVSENVVVLLNTANTMELSFLEDEKIDACVLSGLTGLTGVKGLINVLYGQDEKGNELSPSGRTADTFAYSIDSAPSSINSGYGGSHKYLNLPTSSTYQKGYYDAFLDYYEGIYVGYRYYETAAEEGYIDYDKTVQYPFGYGLSYTTFDWEVQRIEADGTPIPENQTYTLKKDDTLTFYINVTNTGNRPGKDVVELYYSAPYTKGGIEKSSVVLAGFAKTSNLKSKETQGLTLTLSARDMVSYDDTDKNNNGFVGYELEAGNYEISLRSDSHHVKELASTSALTSTFQCQVPSDGYRYDKDEKSGNPIDNRFIGEDAIDGYPIDGSKEKEKITYLSRADFAGTFPKKIVDRERNPEAYTIASAGKPTSEQLSETGYADTSMPTTEAIEGLTLNDMKEADGYDSSDYDDLVSEMSKSELFNNVRDGYFKTAPIDSIGKPIYRDLDSPLGLNTRVTSSTSCSYVAYPSETLLAQTFNLDLAYSMGLSIGKEARGGDDSSAVRGWYGPGLNIHRNPFEGRNGEYYSEDPLLAGKMGAQVCLGAKNQGLVAYAKHFVANETESLREGLYTFMTEQTLRELYLKPFEKAVKEGGVNGLMTSMNRLGACWVGASYALCTEILRNEWGFRGNLITDWVDVGSSYMPFYKGLWAGNDRWLNNADANKMFEDKEYAEDPLFVALAQQSSKNTCYSLVEAEKARSAYDPSKEVSDMTSGGFHYDYSWVWYVVAIDAVLFLVFAFLLYILIRNLIYASQKKIEKQP